MDEMDETDETATPAPPAGKLGYSDNEKRYRRGSLFDFAALNPSRRVCPEV